MRLLLAAAFVVGVATLTAQQRLDPAAIPVEQEPRHHLVFSNEFVRVLDATFPPGYVTLDHSHLSDNVIVTLALGRDDAQALSRIGRANFNRGGYSHTVTNPGPGIARFIEVDVLGTDQGHAPAVPDGGGHVLERENNRVRIYRVKLNAGAQLAPHTHHAGWLTVTVHGGMGAGAADWHAADSANPIAAGSEPLELVEVEPK
jgi:hypothetical protein